VQRHTKLLYSKGSLVFLGGPSITEAGQPIFLSYRFFFIIFNLERINAFTLHPIHVKYKLLLLKNSSLFFARGTYH
jgi:hypothetical protein